MQGNSRNEIQSNRPIYISDVLTKELSEIPQLQVYYQNYGGGRSRDTATSKVLLYK